MNAYNERATKIVIYESGECPHGIVKRYLTPGLCDTYIIMMALRQCFTPDAGCLSFSNNIHNGQKVNKPGRFTCCLKTRHQGGPAHQNLNCLAYATY